MDGGNITLQLPPEGARAGQDRPCAVGTAPSHGGAENAHFGDSNGAAVSAPHELAPGKSCRVEIGAESAQSPVILGSAVRLVPTVSCHVAFGGNPEAAADGSCVYLPAGNPEFFQVRKGHKLAAIQDSAPGALFMTVRV
jgi:hypothetical protein